MEEQDEQLLLLLETLLPTEPPERKAPYFPFPTLETSLWAFLDLHFGHKGLGFSLRLSVTTSNCFLHLSHSYS